VSGKSSSGGTTIASGEEAGLSVIQGVDGSPDDVAEYEIILNCEGFSVEGAYCE